MLVSEALTSARNILRQQDVNSYHIDALLLLCHSLLLSKEQIIFNPNLNLTNQQEQDFLALISRRAKKEPISHLIGRREFFGYDFIVNQNVLDPRPDSESLIELVLENFNDRSANIDILELGVGSGCLLLTLLKKFPNAQAVGVDISQEALEIAQKNADSLTLSAKINLLKSNWFANLNNHSKFDLIISNPPYIKTADIDFLQDEVKIFEPKLALDGGKNGLDCYEIIAQSISKFLKKDGFAILEIGQNQEAEVIKIFTNYGLKFIQDKKDLSGIIRCLMFRN